MPVKSRKTAVTLTPPGLTECPTLRQFQSQMNLSMEALAERMVQRHHLTIRVKKPHVAAANLCKIIATTLRLANRTGFHFMSLRDLSEQSGISMGALYSYFDTKDTLLSMILHTVHEAVENVLVSPMASIDHDPVARLRWFLTTHVYLSELMLPWFVFVFMEAKAFPAEARALARAGERRTEGLIEALLDEGKRRGVFRIDDAATTATLIKPLIQDWYVKHAKYRKRGVTPEQFAQSVIHFVEGAILAHPSGAVQRPAPPFVIGKTVPRAQSSTGARKLRTRSR